MSFNIGRVLRFSLGKSKGHFDERAHPVADGTARSTSRIYHIVYGVIVTVLCTCACAVLVCPNGLNRCTDIDINSGRTRNGLCVFNIMVNSKVRESRLSGELRNLGISIPGSGSPVWKRAFVSPILARTHDDYTYGRVVANCDLLLMMLDKANASDGERRIVLEHLVTLLRTGTPDEVLRECHDLMTTVDKKHGLGMMAH